MVNYVQATSDIVSENVADYIPDFGDTLLVLEGVYRASSNSSGFSVGVAMQDSSQTLFLDGTVFAARGVEAFGANSSVFIGTT
jgi:hypothetical protein